jgi:hypothetical protein
MSLRCSDGEHFVDHCKSSKSRWRLWLATVRPQGQPEAFQKIHTGTPEPGTRVLVIIGVQHNRQSSILACISRSGGIAKDSKKTRLSGYDSSSAPASHLNSGEVEARSQPAPTRGGSPDILTWLVHHALAAEKSVRRGRIKRV